MRSDHAPWKRTNNHHSFWSHRVQIFIKVVVLQEIKMPVGGGAMMNRPIQDQIDELKAKISLLGKILMLQHKK